MKKFEAEFNATNAVPEVAEPTDPRVESDRGMMVGKVLLGAFLTTFAASELRRADERHVAAIVDRYNEIYDAAMAKGSVGQHELEKSLNEVFPDDPERAAKLASEIQANLSQVLAATGKGADDETVLASLENRDR